MPFYLFVIITLLFSVLVMHNNLIIGLFIIFIFGTPLLVLFLIMKQSTTRLLMKVIDEVTDDLELI